jgi:DNA-binding transcriptional LysR family regulator
MLKDSSLMARRLAPSRLVVCAAPSYLDAHGVPTAAAELQNHSCLVYTVDGNSQRDWWPFGVDGEIRVPVRDRLRSNNGDILLAAAVNGAGLVYLPTFIASDAIRAGRLNIVRLDQPTPRGAAIHAVYPPERNLPAKTRALIDFLAAHFGPRPEWDEGLSLD